MFIRYVSNTKTLRTFENVHGEYDYEVNCNGIHFMYELEMHGFYYITIDVIMFKESSISIQLFNNCPPHITRTGQLYISYHHSRAGWCGPLFNPSRDIRYNFNGPHDDLLRNLRTISI